MEKVKKVKKVRLFGDIKSNYGTILFVCSFWKTIQSPPIIQKLFSPNGDSSNGDLE
jgi:hypothetical protein